MADYIKVSGRRSKPLTRRHRVFDINRLPVDLVSNGYVLDLVHDTRQLAGRYKAQTTLLQKNGDWYIGILLPTPTS